MPATKRKPQMKQRRLSVWIWIVLAAIAVLVVTTLFLFRPSAQRGAFPAEINVIDAAEMRTTGAFILDVREPDEWQEVHIPDATLIPLGQLESRLNELPKDQEIVVVCRSGNRSAQGRDILKEAGFEKVTSMAGGMREWQAQGFPTAAGP